MDIQTSEHKRCTVIKTSGRIDGSNAQELAASLKAIIHKGQHNIVFDMADVNFVASAGWWVLIDTQNGSKRWSTVGASPNIIEASWRALADSVEYGLTMAMTPEEVADAR